MIIQEGKYRATVSFPYPPIGYWLLLPYEDLHFLTMQFLDLRLLKKTNETDPTTSSDMTAAKVSSGVVGVGLGEIEAVRTVHLGNGCLDNRTYRLGQSKLHSSLSLEPSTRRFYLRLAGLLVL